MSGIARLAGRTTSLRARLARSLATLFALVLALGVLSFLELPLAATVNARADTPPPPSELVGERTASSRTFDNHDGTYTTSLYPGPVHFRDAQGAWRPISSAVRPTTESGYGFENEANRFRTLFRSTLVNDFLALETGGGRFRVRLQNAAQVAAQTGPRRVTYPDVFSGVDLRYDLRPDGVKETLLLRNAEAPTSYRFLLTPPANARIHAARGRDGSWAFYMAPHARPVFVIDAPWATENDEPDSRRRNASLAVSRIGDVFALDLSVDGQWLRAPGRQFPVRLDPTITIQPTFQDASFDFACPSCAGVASDRLSIGTGSQGFSANTWRSALQFSLADIPAGATISSAKLKLYFDGTCVFAGPGPACGGTAHQIDALRMTSSWSPSSTTSQLLFDPTPLTSFTLPASAPAQWMNWDITGTVQNWASGGLPSNFGLLLKRASETANASGPQPPSRNYAAEPTLGPTLQVTYNGDGGELLEPETIHANGAELRWIPYGGPGVPPFTSYEVHRSSASNYTPSDSTRLTQIMDSGVTSYRDTTAKAGATFTYKVVVNGYETNSRTVTMPAAGQARKLLRAEPARDADTYVTYRTDLVECTNRGAHDRMKVGTDVNSVLRSLVRFDLGDLPIDATISSATLQLWHPETTVAALTVEAHRGTTSWQQGTGKSECTGDGATWYESDGGVEWGQNGGDFDASLAASKSVTAEEPAGWHSFGLTALVQGWAHGDYPNDGVALKSSDETIIAGKLIDYYTSDFAIAPTLRPKLSITYTDGEQASGPVASLSKPVAGELVQGSSVTLSATAVDDGRVANVEFRVDGNPVGTDATEPFSVSWNSTSVANGAHSLTARATDDAGNVTTSAPVSVTVGNSAPPTTGITSPSGGSVTGTVTVNASASDDFGVTKVELYADGLIVETDTAAPYSFAWNTLDPQVPAYDGAHTLTAKAYDTHEQVTTSAPVTVTAANAAGTKYLADLSADQIPGRVVYDSVSPQTYPVSVTVTNRSSVVWAPGEVVLRYRWLKSDGTSTDSGNLSLGPNPLLPNGSTQVSATVEPPALAAGIARATYSLRFDLYEPTTTTWFAAKGDKPLEEEVVVGDRIQEPALGVEPYYSYEAEELGRGMQHLVNVATGGSVVRWTPWQAPGRGLSTVVELTYNASEQNCNHNFCPAGEGWSLGISSLTRFGMHAFKPLGNRVELIDADGTLLTFTDDGNGHWTPPPGTHLYLREVDDYPGEPDAEWAITRPDRTTYFFDEVADDDADAAADTHGLPLSIRDKNGNRIAFMRGGPGNKQIREVVDPGGRSFTLDYYDTSTHNGRLKSITDHSGHRLEFGYGSTPQQGHLVAITEVGGTNAVGSAAQERRIEFEYDSGPHGRLLNVRDPLGVLDPNRPRTRVVYDAQGRLQSRTNRGNEPTTFSYDPGNETTVTKPVNRVTRYRHLTSARDRFSVDSVTRYRNHPSGAETTQTAWTPQTPPPTCALSPARHVWKTIQPTGAYSERCYNRNGLVTDEWNEVRDHTGYTYFDLPADPEDTQSSISLLKTRTDPGGNTWTYAYDPSFVNLLAIEDPTGAETTYSYYPDGTLHFETDANGNPTTYENYDPNGFATRVTDAEGQVTKGAYDADGLQLWAQDANHTDESYPDPRWYRTYFTYNGFHELVRQTEPKSTHLSAGQLIWTETDYDANGNVVSEKGPAFAPAPHSGVPVTTTEYDAMDRPTKVIAPDPGRITTSEYDAAGRLKRTTLPKGVATTGKPNDFVTESVYDGLDRVVTEIAYNGETADGLPARKTHSCYDLAGDLRWQTKPLAHLEQAPTNCETDAGAPAYTTRYGYDDAHRPLTETDPLHTSAGQTRTRTTEYYMSGQSRGQVRYEIDEDGTRTEYTYTARGEVETTKQTYTKDGSNQATRTLSSKTVYDPAGNVLCEVTPRAWDYGSRCAQSPPDSEGFYTTHYDYDALNRLVKISLPTDAAQSGRTYVHRRYDGNGNLTLTTLPDEAATLDGVPENKQTTIDNFDPGWIALTDDHVNPKIRYGYQAQGLQTLREIGHRWGKVMRWGYSLGGNLEFTSDRQGMPSTFAYDLNDNQVEAHQRAPGEEDDLVRFDIRSSYNGFDEQTKVRQFLTSNDWRSTKYAYDDNGMLVSRLDDGREDDNGDTLSPWRIHTFAYDEAGQVETHEDQGKSPGLDANDEQITLTYTPTGWEQTRLLKRKNASGGLDAKLFTSRDYFASGDLESVATYRGDSAIEEMLLEQHSLDYEQCADGSAPPCSTGIPLYLNGNRTVDEFQLKGPEGQASCRTQTCRTRYRYGPRENLTFEYRTRGSSTETTRYRLDSAMNITDEYLTPPAGGEQHVHHSVYDGNRLTELDDLTLANEDRYYRYQDGNLRCVLTADEAACPEAPVTMTPDATLLEDFRWNGRDRLVRFRRFGDDSENASYRYDPLERVVTQSDSRGQTSYSYLGTTIEVSSETVNTQGSPPVTTSYSYGPADERIGLTTTGSHAGEYYFLRNVHSDVSLLIGANADVATASYVYRPYGARDPLSTGDPEDATLLNPYRFNDKHFDPGSATVDMGARRYRAAVGRFVQQDSFHTSSADLGLATEPAMQNRYAFGASNPVRFLETDGHVFVAGTESGPAPLNRNRVSAYALRWAFGKNPRYRKFPGTDCTNFASQALHAGGWQEDRTWNYTPLRCGVRFRTRCSGRWPIRICYPVPIPFYECSGGGTEAWNRVKDFLGYARARKGASFAPWSAARVGDIIAADWHRGPTFEPTHVMVIDGVHGSTRGGRNICISQHSPDRKDIPLLSGDDCPAQREQLSSEEYAEKQNLNPVYKLLHLR